MINYLKSNKINIFRFIVIMIGIIILLIPDNKAVVEIDTELTNRSDIESGKKIKEEIDCLLSEKSDSVIFLANTFKINEDTLIELLKDNNTNLNLLENKDSFDKIVIEYLLTLEKSNNELFDTKNVPCEMNKDYIVKLIKYFTEVYENVDFSIAAGIAQVESGFSSKLMLNKNNIFGGMSNGRLISYRSIEYGVLRYIKLLNDGYFNKGLTTVETIGKVYNPVFNEAGEKVARPIWVSRVNKAKENYLNYDSVDTRMLNNIKNENNALAK